jgi:hypothetical protein
MNDSIFTTIEGPCLIRCIGFDNDRREYAFCEYPILKQTRTGAWIDWGHRKKFVKLKAQKQYASLTKEKAVECYKKRLMRRIVILKSQLSEAERMRNSIFYYTNDAAMKSSPEPRTRSWLDDGY